MSMLARYKKSGGFLQLLNLIETTGSPKREKFMELIRAEDPRWARAIEMKMISFDKIMGWDDNSVAELSNTLQDLTLAILSKTANEAHKTKLFKMISHTRKRKIDELAGTLNPNPAETATAINKVLMETRKMIKEGYLHLNKIDPSLVVDDEIEAKLQNGSLDLGVVPQAAPAASTATESTATDSASSDSHHEEHAPALNFDPPSQRTGATGELADLRKKVENLQKELATVRHENTILKGKLDQIKKIA